MEEKQSKRERRKLGYEKRQREKERKKERKKCGAKRMKFRKKFFLVERIVSESLSLILSLSFSCFRSPSFLSLAFSLIFFSLSYFFLSFPLAVVKESGSKGDFCVGREKSSRERERNALREGNPLRGNFWRESES